MLQQKKNDSSHLVTSAVEGMLLLVKQPNSPSTPPPTLLRFKSNGRDRSLSPGTLEQIFYAPPNEVDWSNLPWGLSFSIPIPASFYATKLPHQFRKRVGVTRFPKRLVTVDKNGHFETNAERRRRIAAQVNVLEVIPPALKNETVNTDNEAEAVPPIQTPLPTTTRKKQSKLPLQTRSTKASLQRRASATPKNGTPTKKCTAARLPMQTPLPTTTRNKQFKLPLQTRSTKASFQSKASPSTEKKESKKTAASHSNTRPLSVIEKQNLSDKLDEMSKKDVLHGAAKKLNDFNPECFKGPKLLRWKAHCKKVKTKAFMMRCLTELETIRSFRKHLATLDPKFKPIRDRWKDCLPPPDHVNRGSHALLTIMLTGGVSDVNVIPHLEPTVKGRGFDLSFQKIDSMPLIQFCRIIRRCSIWAVNGIKIKKAARHILHNHGGKLPRDISSLMSRPYIWCWP